MRHPTIALFILLVAAFCAHVTPAAFDAATFALIRLELEERRDNDFGGTLDGAAKKRQSAVVKSLDAISSDAEDLADDVAIAAKVLKSLGKPYKDEFSAEPPGEFPVVFDLLLRSLRFRVQTELDALAARIPGLDAKTGAKVQKKVDAATAALEASGAESGDLKARNGKLASAAKAIAAGRKTADKAGGGGGGILPGLHATVDGQPFVADADSVQSEYYDGDQTLQIYGSRRLPNGTRETIYLLVKGVAGPGTYPLTAGNALGNFQVLTAQFETTIYDLDFASGSVEVQALSLTVPTRVTVPHFSYTATNATAGTKTITDGTHDISTPIYHYSGNGF